MRVSVASLSVLLLLSRAASLYAIPGINVPESALRRDFPSFVASAMSQVYNYSTKMYIRQEHRILDLIIIMVCCTHVTFLLTFFPKNKHNGKAVMRVFVRAITSFGGFVL